MAENELEAAWHLPHLNFEHSDRLKTGPFVVYLLAHARRDAFYIDVAEDLDMIQRTYVDIQRTQEWTLPQSQWMPPRLVWFEIADDEVAAHARLKELRSLPHAWQRRLVDARNPVWVDLWAYHQGMRAEHILSVGERRLVMCADLIEQMQSADRARST